MGAGLTSAAGMGAGGTTAGATGATGTTGAGSDFTGAAAGTGTGGQALEASETQATARASRATDRMPGCEWGLTLSRSLDAMRRGYAGQPYPRRVAKSARRNSSTGPRPVVQQQQATSGPSVRLLLLPFLVFAAAACAAGLHKAIGEPLGTAASSSLAEATKTLMLMLVVYGPFAGYVQRQNALAATSEQNPRAIERRAGSQPGEEGGDDDDDDDARRKPVRRSLPR